MRDGFCRSENADFQRGCGLTLVAAPGRRLTKLWRPDGCDAYDNVRLVNLEPIAVGGLDDMCGLLEALAYRPDAAVVRGAIADPNRTRGVRRLLHPDPKTGDPPTLIDVPRRWVALDIDGLPLPRGIAPRDLEAVGEVVRARLPAAFRPARCVVQATASHCMKPGARVRLWFWFSRPAASAELRRWLAPSPLLDHSLFGAAQIHYTAAPLFEPPLADPLPRRLVSLQGAATVQVPPPALLAEGRPPPRAGLKRGVDAAATGALRWAEEEIARQAEGARHPTAVRVAAWLQALAERGEVPPSAVADALERGLARAGKPPGEGRAIARWFARRAGL